MGITTAITTVTTAPKNVHWRAIGLFVAVVMGSAFAWMRYALQPAAWARLRES